MSNRPSTMTDAELIALRDECDRDLCDFNALGVPCDYNVRLAMWHAIVWELNEREQRRAKP